MTPTYKDYRKIKTKEDLYKFSKENGYQASIDLLRLYAEDGEPLTFVGKLTDRQICVCMSLAIEEISIDQLHEVRLSETKYGTELFNFLKGIQL